MTSVFNSDDLELDSVLVPLMAFRRWRKTVVAQQFWERFKWGKMIELLWKVNSNHSSLVITEKKTS